MEEDKIKWQFAPDFYKYLVKLLEKASDFKQIEDYDNAFLCYVDVFSALIHIIEIKDIKLAEKIKEYKENCEKYQDEIYSIMLKNNPDKEIMLSKNFRLFKKSLDLFFEFLMRGAYISGALLPIDKVMEKGKEALQVRF